MGRALDGRGDRRSTGRGWTRAATALGLLATCAAPAGSGTLYAVETEILWRTPREHAGKCSPRTADLNADGFDDVVIGTGLEDHWGEVVALDGKTGQVLWSRRMPDEVLTAMPLADIDGDRIADLFIGGRKRLHDVFALSGKDGSTLWQLTEANPQAEFLPVNFINLLPVDDRTGDGLDDLLVVQTGGLDARRPAARFYWVDSARGSLLQTGVAPDGRECYSMPLFQERAGKADRFYVGTGGETLSGNLLKLAYPSLREEWRVRSIGGGFIGSPLLVDLEPDGTDELVATGMNGAVYRIDADTGSVRWRWRERPFWTYVSPAVGAFNDEPTLDVVAGFNRGIWPRRDLAKLVWLDGASGDRIAEQEFDRRSRFTASSPLVLDVNGDGRDETLIVLSNPVPDSAVTDESHELLLIDTSTGVREVLDLELEGYSIATPLVADLDGNGKLDVIHASHFEVMRIELSVSASAEGRGPHSPEVRWGEMRGPNGAGIYHRSP